MQPALKCKLGVLHLAKLLPQFEITFPQHDCNYLNNESKIKIYKAGHILLSNVLSETTFNFDYICKSMQKTTRTATYNIRIL